MAAAGASLQRGGSSNSNGNGSRSSSSSSACARVAPVVAVSSAHSLDYDCTDCGSFLFGHRGRVRSASRTQGQGTRSGHHHSHRNSLSEHAQAHAQRLLAVTPTPFAPAVSSQHMILPPNEQLSSSSSFAVGESVESAVAYASGVGVQSNEASEPVSLQASDEDAEEGGSPEATTRDFVACHGATPAGLGASDSAATLAEIFRCFICLGKVVDAQLCPCCSKLVCQPCIKRWLTDQKSECPHCRAPLLVSQLVSCRFISEISLEVEKIQGKLGDSPIDKYCPAHDSPLLYFCTTCSVAVCSDCAVLIEDHRNHTFEKLSVAYGRHKKKIRMEAAGLRKRRKELSALVTSVDKNIEAVLKSKDESAAELQIAFKRMQSRLEEQLKCKLLALLAQKGSMTQEMELLDTILQELDQQLNSIPKSDLIAQEPNMSRMLQDIRTRTFSEISRTPIPPEFTSEVVPSYEHGELTFKNCKETLCETSPATDFTPGGDPNTSEVLSSKEVVYSEPLCASGVTWRLKVYPNGSGASQGTHLSVFLEMVEGGNEAATYEYGIELLHRSRPNQRIVRKFSSEFEAGACWGYYQFFRIDLLEKEGYLQAEEDAITLRFYVRPLTYQQQCQDLRRSLAALQVERDEAATQVAVIRRAFAATFFQRRRRRSSRSTLPIPNDQHVLSLSQARVSSPTLAVRKPSHIKHIPTKHQDCSSTKPNPNKWSLPGMFPQVEEGEEEEDGDHHPRPFNMFAIPACVTKPSPIENPFAEFPALDDGAPSAERLDTQRPSHHELWMKKNDDIFQIPRTTRLQSSKKLRSRKAHKLLLAPETLLLPGFSGQQLASLTVVEAGPSSKQLVQESSMAASALVSSSDDGDGGDGGDGGDSPREKCDDGGLYFDAEIGTTTPTPAVNIVEMSNAVEGADKFPYYSPLSGCSSNFCSPEIEDWGNLK